MKKSNAPQGDEPEKKSLKLTIRQKPVAEVETSVGRIYLYPLRRRDLTDFEKLKSVDAVRKVRTFLASISSLTLESVETPERVPLNPEIAETLSDEEVEQLAEVYVHSSEWNEIAKDGEDLKAVVREVDEAYSTYMIRLMQNEVARQHQSTKRMLGTILGSNSGLFDQVRKSTSELGSTLNAFEQLTKTAKPSQPEIQPVLSHHLHNLKDQIAQREWRNAEQRTEQVELARLTGRMTAESSKTLKDLAEAATILMEQFDARDQKTDKSTRTQIKIAVGSVAVSALLALLALIVSGFAYFQDQVNSVSGDLWQAKLLTAIEQGNQQRSAVQRENEALQEQVRLMGVRIADLEAAQHVVAKTVNSKKTPE